MVIGRPSPLYRQRLWRHFYFAQSATFLRGVHTKLSMQTRQAGGKTTTLLINETTVFGETLYYQKTLLLWCNQGRCRSVHQAQVAKRAQTPAQE